ncbi:MAG: hypothetical protein ACYDCQ_04545 [Dehalococcoidia bacterium]
MALNTAHGRTAVAAGEPAAKRESNTMYRYGAGGAVLLIVLILLLLYVTGVI